MKKKFVRSWGGLLTAGMLASAMLPAGVAADTMNGWKEEGGKYYWYEDGVRQGAEGVGKEIYDPDTEAYYWLNGTDNGAMKKGPVVFPDGTMKYYDLESGHMIKGDHEIDGVMYHFDEADGHLTEENDTALWKGTEVGTVGTDTPVGGEADGNTADASLQEGTVGTDTPEDTKGGQEGADGDKADAPLTEENGDKEGAAGTDTPADSGMVPEVPETVDGDIIDLNGWRLLAGRYYWYENGERQGTEGKGKEIYDPETDAWYWLDAQEEGARAVDRDVYIESISVPGEGRWVRYDENGQMVKGWSGDREYYFNLVDGAMVKDKAVIGGIEYEFDQVTGRRITPIGFGEFGLACNVDAEEEYDYITCTYLDESLSTTAKAKFAYSTFESDEDHEAKEGYEWKQTIVSLVYDDENAAIYGGCWRLLYNLDYYNFMNLQIEKFHSDDIVIGEGKISFHDEEYDITTRYEVLENQRDENGTAHVTICFECHVPTEYDGMVVALYDAANADEGAEPMARLDSNSLVFRME